jgi:pimeloyl-ACP methyl ester carboxylesterase
MPENAPDTIPPRAARWTEAPTLHLRVGGQTHAYRDLGPDHGTPVVLLTHLGATLDEWDPRIVDALATGRRVIAVDLSGVGGSTGRVPHTVKEMANTARAFIATLGLKEIDLIGFSLGGFIAQQIALDEPTLLRRLVLTGTGPAGCKGIDRKTGASYIYYDMLRGALHRTDPKEFLFFRRNATGKAAAKDYLARIHERVMDRDQPMRLRSFRRQIRAIQAWGRQAPQDLSGITAPTLIANGDHDRMVPTSLSVDLHRRIPDSTLFIYPDSGHGGIFQHPEQFVPTLLAHLDAPA